MDWIDLFNVLEVDPLLLLSTSSFPVYSLTELTLYAGDTMNGPAQLRSNRFINRVTKGSFIVLVAEASSPSSLGRKNLRHAYDG